VKTDLELLKEYLQSEIDCSNHKLFIFDENNNAAELKTIDGFNAITDLEQEIERLNNIINMAITAINTYQDSKTLSIGYENLKRIRGILRGNDFDIQRFEEYLKELKENGNNE